jgi:hypothetical protein
MTRASYFNQKLEKTIFENVYRFTFADYTIALAISRRTNDSFFINMEGKPSIEGISDIEVSHMKPHQQKIYYNQKNNNIDFYYIYDE